MKSKLINDHTILLNKTKHQRLNLEGMGLTDQDVIEVIDPYLNAYSITELHLKGNLIGNVGAIALSKNTTLCELDLGGNWIGDEGAVAFSKNTTLTTFSLNGNRLKDEGIIALSKNTTLTKLDLCSNQIGNEGAIALSKNTTLCELDLSANQIGNEGAIALSKNTTLTKLDLGWSQIGDEGAIALAKNTIPTNLLLNAMDISTNAAQALASNANREIHTHEENIKEALSKTLNQKVNWANQYKITFFPTLRQLCQEKMGKNQPTVDEINKKELPDAFMEQLGIENLKIGRKNKST
jgi:Ran GTPase-activating protein (RanGAP) involved in mRNA processing and transport